MIILASQSAIRRQLLAQAGVPFEAMASPFDEEEAKSSCASDTSADIARILALGKAKAVAALHPKALVIGADQTLEFEGKTFAKPQTPEKARKQLLQFRGKSHHLHSALSCVKGTDILWRNLSTATLTMRSFSDAFLDRYLASEEQNITSTVGGYKLEGRGIQLFDNIEGDYHTILGLPLLPLLEFLRSQRHIPT